MHADIATASTETTAQTVAHDLPSDREAWPKSAIEAFQSLLRELNGWSRSTDNSYNGNLWIAETAVREVWAAEACAG